MASKRRKAIVGAARDSRSVPVRALAALCELAPADMDAVLDSPAALREMALAMGSAHPADVEEATSVGLQWLNFHRGKAW